jgi:8-oxo-dGTP pyrophosphatase MutT (NUDIX family)
MVGVLRPAVRVVCLDQRQRLLLLLRWRDPADGSYLWEPPGGGIEPGEQPIDAARRELQEETGLPGASVIDRHVMVGRDVRWNGQHYQGEEAFFLARVDQPGPLSRAGLAEYERGWLRGHAWVAWSKIASLPDTVEPPQLLGILAALDPSGPWRLGHGQPPPADAFAGLGVRCWLLDGAATARCDRC